jgi:hypothetical protein
MKQLVHGIYEALINEYLRDALAQHPELRTVFGKEKCRPSPTLLKPNGKWPSFFQWLLCFMVDKTISSVFNCGILISA